MSIYEVIRSTYAALGTPLESDADPGLIENALSLAGFKLDVDAGRLVANQNGQMVPIEPALRNLALRPEMQSHFVLPLERVTKASQLKTRERRCEYIARFGLARFEQLLGAKK